MYHAGLTRLSISFALVTVIIILSSVQSSFGLQFYLSKETECFSQKVGNRGDTVRGSFVVVKRKSRLHASTFGIDLVVKGPNGEQVHDERDKKSERFRFIAHQKGMYQFCFINKSKYSEMVDFNVEVSHHEPEEYAKDEQFTGIKKQITSLEDWLHELLFEQEYMMADQHRMEEINKATAFWSISKAVAESVALVSSSILQVYLLKRLFTRAERPRDFI